MSGRGRARAAAAIATMLLAPLFAVTPRPAPAADGGVPADHPVHALVAAERAFAAMSLERGMRDAFIAWLADTSVLFRPLPVDGQQLWRSRPASPATLAWEPSYAELAGSGELGVTTGPWEFRPGPDSMGVAATPDQYGHGHFVSVWKRQPADGGWRVIVDIGISHARPERPAVGSGALTLGPMHVKPASARGAKARADLAAVDPLWAAAVRKGGAGALGTWAAMDLRYLRDGEPPSLGRAAAQARLATLADLLAIHPAGSGTAASDDLGYTYGVIERRGTRGDAPDSSVYLHVWRKERDRKWRMSLAVENPLQRSR